MNSTLFDTTEYLQELTYPTVLFLFTFLVCLYVSSMSAVVALPLESLTPSRDALDMNLGLSLSVRPCRPTLGSPPLAKRYKHGATVGPVPPVFLPTPFTKGLAPTPKVSVFDTSLVRTVSSADLASRMSVPKPFLLLDCRTFFAFNASHIKNAVNVNCSDRLSRKRLQEGRLELVDLIPSKEGRELFRKRTSRDLILYDEATTDLDMVSSSEPLYIVLSHLLRENIEVRVLQGGLGEFRRQHAGLCTSTPKPTPRHGLPQGPLYSPTQTLVEPKIETAVASQVLPFLYLGNERDASDLDKLRELNVTYVLNITSHVPLHFENQGVRYKRIPASDSGQQNLRQYFDEAFQFIDEARQNDANILVHCHAGVSRSATIVIAYIMKNTFMTMIDAYKFVKGKRSIISPNFNFMGQLLEFEQNINAGIVERSREPKLQGIETTV